MRNPVSARAARSLLYAVLALLPVAATAQDADSARIIHITTENGTVGGNLRYGPIVYSHPEPEGIIATVSNLTILSGQAELRVPAEEQGETLLSQAEGRREASFEGGVRVTRSRLAAQGPELVYSEATGLGILSGGASIRIEPQEEGEDVVDIATDEVEFDVDTDRSTSRGGVRLVSGNQTATAEELTFEENRDLGCLSNEGGQVTVTRTDADGDELVITADETCVLTEEEKLYARGNVTVVDGSITSSGEEVFFDDELSIAEILGSPARSVDEANGATLESDRIRQHIEFDYVEAIDASAPTDFDPEAFRLSSAAP